LNTDDPSISQITLSNEYQVAHRDLGLPLSEIKARVLAAAQAAFLPPEEKQALVERLKTELQSLPLE
jgi:adenosine deaminase